MNLKGMWYLVNSQIEWLPKLNHEMWFSSKENFQEKGISMILIDSFEVDESHEDALNPDKKDESDLLPSGSVHSSGSVPLGTDSETTFLHRSQRGNIHRRQYEIKGEVFMCTLQDADELKNYQETIKSPTSEE